MVRRSFGIHLSFPNELAAVGRLLTEYGELEVTLMNCVHVARNDFDGTLKAMFRTRGESQRIDIADGLGRTTYKKYGLDTEFAMGISAMRYALKIRNRYAHCIWHSVRRRLYFIALEDIAAENYPIRNLDGVTAYAVSDALLAAQEEWFRYTDDLLAWVNFEDRHIIKRHSPNPLTKPTPRKQPKLFLSKIILGAANV